MSQDQEKLLEQMAEFLKNRDSRAKSILESIQRDGLSDEFYKKHGLDEYVGLDKKAEALNFIESQSMKWKKVKDPFGDGDQTPVKGLSSQLLRQRWGSGADYNPFYNMQLSNWLRDCYNGDLKAVTAHLDQDITLLERRESVLHVCGLFHVVNGARTVGNEEYPPHVQAKVNRNTDFVGCIKLMISRGARVNAKDFAGHTPLHLCTGLFSNSLSLEIARVLLENGADPNARNRFGATPLFEASQNCKIKAIELLFEFGAKAGVVDNDGMHLLKIASVFQDVSTIFARAEAKRIREMNGAEKLAGLYRACELCKSDKESKRCTGCFIVFYCSVECQKEDWSKHKVACKKSRKAYRSVNLTDNGVSLQLNHASRKMDRVKPMVQLKPGTKIHFLVKVQIPLNQHVEYYKWSKMESGPKPEKGPLMVYNEDRSIVGYVSPSQNIYNDLFKAVFEHGVSEGVKAFFYATYDDKNGLKINVDQIQKPESW